MIRDMNQFLADLDKHAAEFNFPVLDNAYVEYAAARLSAFTSDQDVLIVFEVLGFSTKETEFVDDLYAFGTCVEREGFIGEDIVVSSSSQQPVFDSETNECVANWRKWSIRLRDEVVSFSPTREEYASAGIAINRDPGPCSLKEIELLRFLVYNLAAQRLFLSDGVLLSHFPSCRGLSKFIQTTRWQHPDVADGEKPSRNVSMRSLVEALFRGDSRVFNPGRPNTDWKSWLRTARGA
jgi:hypothetical protein